MATTQSLSTRDRINATALDDAGKAEATRLLAAVRDLAPKFAARSAEIETARRIPGDIAAQLRQIGFFGALVPRRHGGSELSVPDVLPMIETLSAADSSIGWVAMIGTISELFCTRLARETYDRIYANGANPMVVGVGTPVGKAEIIDGGFRVSGRWPFASGCQNAQWLAGHCLVTRNGVPEMTEHGPITKFVVLPAESWRIEETWNASGLTGSGSHHVVLDTIDVTEASICDALSGPSNLSGPLGGVFVPFIATIHAAVPVGIAAGAIADLVAQAEEGRRQLFAATDLRDSIVFQHELGKLQAAWRAARALLRVQAEDLWERALAGTLDGTADFTESLQGSAWIHSTCADVVRECYRLGGSSSIFHSSPLQRRLRDIHAAKQHVFAQDRFYARAGANALGFAPVDPLFGR